MSYRLVLRFVWFWLWHLIRPARATFDCTDNSVTINQSLYHMLLQLGVEGNNRITLFQLPGGRCGFTLYPPQLDAPENTYFAHLQYNEQLHSIGFEQLRPTINWLFYHWGTNQEACSLRCTPRLMEGSDLRYIYFEIQHPWT